MNLYCTIDEALASRGGDLFKLSVPLFAVRIVRTATGYARHCTDSDPLMSFPEMHHIWPDRPRTIYIPPYISALESQQIGRRLHHAFRFREESSGSLHLKLVARLERGDHVTRLWDDANWTLLTSAHRSLPGYCIPPSLTGREIVGGRKTG